MELPPRPSIPAMPSLPPHPCAHPLCPNLLTSGRYCEEHARLRWRTRTAPRLARPYDKMQHRRWRKLILGRDPICRVCHTEPSTEADHIVPLDQGGGWGLDNGQGLCASCHGKKTREENKRPTEAEEQLHR